MKDIVISGLIKNIKEHKNFDDKKLEIIKYGLEVFYTTATKIIVLVMLSFIFNTTKELLLILAFYSLLRMFGFGLHAGTNKICWIISLIILVIGPIIIKYLSFNSYLLFILSIISVVLIMVYAPADTEKRPIISKKKRIIFKCLCSFISVIFTIIIILTNNKILENAIIFSLLLETIMILPVTYKLMKMKYRNYTNFSYMERR